MKRGKKREKRLSNVLATLHPAGRYSVRLLERDGNIALDIREYVESQAYTGWTRRGIILTSPEQMMAVHSAIELALKETLKRKAKPFDGGTVCRVKRPKTARS